MVAAPFTPGSYWHKKCFTRLSIQLIKTQSRLMGYGRVSVKQFVYGCVEKIYSKILNKYNMGTDIPLWHLSESSSVYCLYPHAAQVRSDIIHRWSVWSRIAEKTFQVFAHRDCHHFMNILIISWTCPSDCCCDAPPALMLRYAGN